MGAEPTQHQVESIEASVQVGALTAATTTTMCVWGGKRPLSSAQACNAKEALACTAGESCIMLWVGIDRVLDSQKALGWATWAACATNAHTWLAAIRRPAWCLRC